MTKGFGRFRPVPDEQVYDEGKAQRDEDERRQSDNELAPPPTRYGFPAGIRHDRILQTPVSPVISHVRMTEREQRTLP